MNESKQMKMWEPEMIQLLGKEKWESLTYWQQMCEIAALQRYRKENPLCKFFGE